MRAYKNEDSLRTLTAPSVHFEAPRSTVTRSRVQGAKLPCLNSRSPKIYADEPESSLGTIPQQLPVLGGVAMELIHMRAPFGSSRACGDVHSSFCRYG